MPSAERRALSEALSWHARLSSSGDADWDAFTKWLEQDEGHSIAYERVAVTDANLDELLRGQTPSAPARAEAISVSRVIAPPPPRRFMRRYGWAAAAALVPLALAYSLWPEGTDFKPIETAAGEQRTVALADGSKIYLNGDTRILLDRNLMRLAKVERGQASFEIRHDSAHPFTVLIGSSKIQDVGTVFDISMSAASFEVAVADGAIMFNPGDDNIRLGQGGRLEVSARDNSVSVGSTSPRAVGGWRHGYLEYQAEPLEKVAGDIGRSLGTDVIASPGIAFRTFSGVIQIDRDQARFFKRLEGMLGVRAKQTKDGWQLDPA